MGRMIIYFARIIKQLLPRNRSAPDLAHPSLPLLPRNRSGSHVGMMLSFAIFVTFIIFLYSVLSPAIKVGEDKTLILNYVETGIIKNTTSNFTSVSVQIDSASANKKCIKLNLFFTVLDDEMPTTSNGATVIVKNGLGEEQEAFAPSPIITDPSLVINRESTNKKEDLFFRVYYTSNFTELSSGGTDCVSLSNTGANPGYTIASVTIDKYMIEEKIIYLVDFYNEHYEKLKEDLKIPTGDEVWFKFTKSDGTSIAPPEKEIKTINVFSNDVPIQYVDSNANVQSGFINIKVW